jgi:transaldolase
MGLFLDTSKLAEIERFHRMGIIDGVTTNPSILLKDGIQDGLHGIELRMKEIAALVDPLPVSVEVTSNDYQEALRQALIFSQWAKNMVIKVTVHGPQGELGNLELIHHLETVHHIPVNVTAMMSAQQCLVAALAGASYVSIFAGRMNNMGYNSCDEIARLRRVLDRFGLKAQIIAASTREVLNVIEWLDAGAHIVTVLPELLKGMIVHPYTKETVQMFLRDGAAVTQAMAGQLSAAPAAAAAPSDGHGHEKVEVPGHRN